MTHSISRFWIATLGAGRTRGRIGMAPCPGSVARAPSAGADVRDLEQDLGTLVRWSPQLVVTLLEGDELSAHRIGTLPQTLATHGIPWQHLPMSASGLADPAFEQRWTLAVPGLRDLLRTGGKLLLHCSDGMLRSGLAAGRLLIELGCRPEDAVNRVQAARPGALTAPEQREYLLGRAYASRAESIPPALRASEALAVADLIVAAHDHNTAAWSGARDREMPVDLAKYRQSR